MYPPSILEIEKKMVGGYARVRPPYVKDSEPTEWDAAIAYI
jgi:hypothetical protein